MPKTLFERMSEAAAPPPPPALRVLTIFQPWASLVIAGAKPYEFRGYLPPRTIIGKRIVIHAAARKIDKVEVRAIIRAIEQREVNPEACHMTCLHPELAMPILEQALDDQPGFPRRGDLPWGCGLGTAVCGEGRSGFDIAEEFGLEHVNDSDRDEHANFGWPLTDIEKWEVPIEARGSQGIWFWPTPLGTGL